MPEFSQPQTAIEGQLSPEERAFITKVILEALEKPRVVLEIGTWLGGGSTLHILRALQKNGVGHLWGVEADRGIYDKMLSNIQAAAPEAAGRFTPLFGFSTEVLPAWLDSLETGSKLDVAFLDGGGNPIEQIQEFKILAAHFKIGGVLMSHDARTRKGKWFVPYISLLDNWQVEVFDFTFAGLLHARKIKAEPSPASLKAAEQKLKGLRLEPKEVVARLLPHQLNGLILSLMPASLRRRLTIEA